MPTIEQLGWEEMEQKSEIEIYGIAIDNLR